MLKPISGCITCAEGVCFYHSFDKNSGLSKKDPLDVIIENLEGIRADLRELFGDEKLNTGETKHA